MAQPVMTALALVVWDEEMARDGVSIYHGEQAAKQDCTEREADSGGNRGGGDFVTQLCQCPIKLPLRSLTNAKAERVEFQG